ncbi:hypothetical protein Back11_02340 [Paenibacillus baekrokdamisoli]|uniref:Uncharacterized protein n=1 Tax=Paenibacillus baekrokdamisoli TaxID=1712516 RepID=A0A3G9J7E2_9BACL|nr:serine hydrolase [Paenibacillus baekrokdamisoli]MBB3069134.1 CubicO group peptidase (beta-lactamase class C family) [Paenibacillus baekrokdamisoli]BBH18889.1 hypothetical protein Back11_02340 [Paenibacillus baekrokdamisoli]
MSESQQLPRSTPEEQGVSPAVITALLHAWERTGQEIHSFILVRHGKVIAEGGWKPYSPDLPRFLNSVTKSFTSAAVGFAVSEGRLSVEDTVLSFFPEKAPAYISEHLSSMRVKHLLAMATGHTEDTTPHLRRGEERDWVRAFLGFPVNEEPGTRFIYNGGASHMLSAILQKLTGETVHQYLQQRLFEPLGIEDTKWDTCPSGISTGGWGLTITTEDIAKFGQLYLNKGEWEGRQLLSEEWITESVQSHISNGDDPNSDWGQGYGYQFWRNQHGGYRADGAFGQAALVMPEQDAVLALTAAVTDFGAVLDQVWRVLLPALDASRSPLPSDDAAREELADKLSSLSIEPPRHEDHSIKEDDYSGKRFVRNEQGSVADFDCISFDFEDEQVVMTWSWKDKKETQSILCGLGVWQENQLRQEDDIVRAVASGTWQDETTFVVSLRILETAYQDTYQCRFEGNQLHAVYSRAFNVYPDKAWAASFES